MVAGCFTVWWRRRTSFADAEFSDMEKIYDKRMDYFTVDVFEFEKKNLTDEKGPELRTKHLDLYIKVYCKQNTK